MAAQDKGMWLTGSVIPRHLIEIFEPDQLELLISGITTVDVDELKNATQMSGWKSTDPEIAWFWRALRSFSQEERSRFLMFVTSSSRVPLGGFTQLQGASGIQPFQIQKVSHEIHDQGRLELIGLALRQGWKSTPSEYMLQPPPFAEIRVV